MNRIISGLSLPIIILSAIILISGCKNNQESTTSVEDKVVTPAMQGHYPMWSKNANMYEVNIRQFTPEGTFSAFEQHIPRLKEMGVDILWLMPIYPISDTKKKGSLGSYYAVSDYAKVNPEFGTIQEFKSLVNTVHNAGMKIILDFVPNHTGWDHIWITEHPDYYTQDVDGNIIDPIDPSTGESWGWTDVADLNFDNNVMREHMIADLVYWLEEEDIDGFRMDVAHGVPENFWDQVSNALIEAKPDVFMLAESQIADLRNKKYFQCDYGWGFHHLLNELAHGEKGPKDVRDWYKTNSEEYSTGWHIQFTSNHDENSWAGSTKERMGEAHDALATLAYTIEGMPLIYGGQEEPLEKRLEFFDKDDIGFNDYEKAEWYTTILRLKHENEALWNGEFGGIAEFVHVDDQVLVFTREKNGDKVFCILNLTDKPAQYIMEYELKGYIDGFTAQAVNFGVGDRVELAKWDYKIFSKT